MTIDNVSLNEFTRRRTAALSPEESGMSVVERIHERRVAPRVDARYRAHVTEPPERADVPGDEELLAPLFGAAVNLSETGALVEVDEPLCAGRQVVVAIEMDGRTLSLKGRVARTTRLRGAPIFRLGIEFADLDDAAREAIRARIRRGIVSAFLN
jgi:hypothetical protein